MPDKCVNDPAKDCPHGTKLALLEQRVGDLEKWQDGQKKFLDTYHEDREARIERDAKLDAKMEEMDRKLDKVVEYQEAQKEKPGKRWEGIVDKALWLVIGAVITFVLVRLGLPT